MDSTEALGGMMHMHLNWEVEHTAEYVCFFPAIMQQLPLPLLLECISQLPREALQFAATGELWGLLIRRGAGDYYITTVAKD